MGFGRTTKYSLLNNSLLLLHYWIITVTQTTLWVSGSGYCGLCSKLSGGANAYMKLNWTHASSAAVERLFSASVNCQMMYAG